MSAKNKNFQLRQRISYEAARLMVGGSIFDHAKARAKAAARLGVSNRRLWPSNAEVQEAVLQQQRLFQPDQDGKLLAMRRRALQAMQAFSRFRPRLIGPVLDGHGAEGGCVSLYLFADTPDDVMHALLEQRIPWEEGERQLSYAGGVQRGCPVFRFLADEVPVEFMVLPCNAERDPPLSSLTERPERGAGIRQLQELLDAGCSNDLEVISVK